MTVDANRPLLDLFAFQFTDEPWIVRANCNGVAEEKGNHDEFFSPVGATQLQAIHLYCRDCPVAWECLEYSVRLEMGFGIWGGIPPEDRHRLLQRNHWRTGTPRFRADWEITRSHIAERAQRVSIQRKKKAP